MNHNYPSLDSSGHKSHDAHNAGYEYVEPPRSSNAVHDINQADLKQPLIENAPKKTSDPNDFILIIYSICILVEFGVFFLIWDRYYIFEYCFWKFSMGEFWESQFYASTTTRESGKIKDLLLDLNCDKGDFERCAGLCDVAQNYSDSYRYFLYAYILRWVLTAVSTGWIGYESKRKNYVQVRKIFGYFHLAAFIVLIAGISYTLIHPGFQNLEQPTDLNDGMKPVDFEWKVGMYLIAFISIWMPIISLITYLKLKSSN